jgi:flagellar export protein FliJ
MDELGVEAVRLAQHIDQLRMQEASVLAREETELALAANDPSFASLIPAYRARVKLQTGQIQTERAETEGGLAEVRNLLNAAYQEKSKFEQLIEQEAIRAAAERATKDQAALDEVAVNRAGLAK